MIPREYIEEAGLAMLNYGARATPELREVLGVDLNVFRVATCLLFLDDSGRVHRQRNLTPASRSSYLLKHVAEAWGAAHGYERYISTADFVCAALWRGVPVEPHHQGGNPWLGLRLLRRAPPTARASRKWPQLRLVAGEEHSR